MKLTESDVSKIKALLQLGGMTQEQIADKFKVSRSYVSDIATKRAHADVSPDKKLLKNIPQHDPTDAKILELQAENLHLKKERNRARQEASANAKQQGLFKAVAEEMEQRIKPFEVPPVRVLTKEPDKDAIVEDLVLHLSDGHHDQVVTAESSGGLEEYNFQVSCRRAETLIDTVLKWSQVTLDNFDFPRLTILAYGDHTSGEIHGHEQRSYFRNQFKNCLAIGQLHALMFRDLSPYFETINCLYVPGNHGRRSVKKDYYGAQENWDYLVAKVAELHCADMDNVFFTVPNCFSVNLDINGIGFNISHGDDVMSSLGIPFYGLARRQKALMALNNMTGSNRIRYFCMGHHHTQSNLSDLDGELIINGAWPATDPFAYNKFAGYREPSQLLHGVHKDRGITWRLPVQLKSRDESKGPRRYKINI